MMIMGHSPFTECPPPFRCLERPGRKESQILPKGRRSPWDSDVDPPTMMTSKDSGDENIVMWFISLINIVVKRGT